MKRVVATIVGLAVMVSGAGGAWAQTADEPARTPGPNDRVQRIGAWTLSDLGSKPGDDSDREVTLRRSIPDVDFVLYRQAGDGAGLSIKFGRCDGMNVNSGFSFEGAIPARAKQLRDEIKDAFKDFAKACPPKAGEEEALVVGLDEADRVLETLMHDHPYVYPPDPDEAKPQATGKPKGKKKG